MNNNAQPQPQPQLQPRVRQHDWVDIRSPVFFAFLEGVATLLSDLTLAVVVFAFLAGASPPECGKEAKTQPNKNKQKTRSTKKQAEEERTEGEGGKGDERQAKRSEREQKPCAHCAAGFK